MNGWIKISRDLRKHWLWTDAARLQWWLDLLFMASWEDRSELVQGRLIEIKRGEVVASNEYLRLRWGVCDKTIRKFLKMLEDDKMIMRSVHPKYCIVTICNYDKYQAAETDDVLGLVPPTAHPKNATLEGENAHPSVHLLTSEYTDVCAKQDIRGVHPSVPLKVPLTAHPIEEIKEIKKDIIIKKQAKSGDDEFWGIEQMFEDFRKAYPGRKRGHATELDAFKRKHKNWTSIVPLLMPALQRLLAHNEAAQANGQFVPSFANLSTWLYQARWEDELPEIAPIKKQATKTNTNTEAQPIAVNYDADDDFGSIDK